MRIRRLFFLLVLLVCLSDQVPRIEARPSADQYYDDDYREKREADIPAEAPATVQLDSTVSGEPPTPVAVSDRPSNLVQDPEAELNKDATLQNLTKRALTKHKRRSAARIGRSKPDEKIDQNFKAMIDYEKQSLTLEINGRQTSSYSTSPVTIYHPVTTRPTSHITTTTCTNNYHAPDWLLNKTVTTKPSIGPIILPPKKFKRTKDSHDDDSVPVTHPHHRGHAKLSHTSRNPPEHQIDEDDECEKEAAHSSSTSKEASRYKLTKAHCKHHNKDSGDDDDDGDKLKELVEPNKRNSLHERNTPKDRSGTKEARQIQSRNVTAIRANRATERKEPAADTEQEESAAEEKDAYFESPTYDDDKSEISPDRVRRGITPDNVNCDESFLVGN